MFPAFCQAGIVPERAEGCFDDRVAVNSQAIVLLHPRNSVVVDQSVPRHVQRREEVHLVGEAVVNEGLAGSHFLMLIPHGEVGVMAGWRRFSYTKGVA